MLSTDNLPTLRRIYILLSTMVMPSVIPRTFRNHVQLHSLAWPDRLKARAGNPPARAITYTKTVWPRETKLKRLAAFSDAKGKDAKGREFHGEHAVRNVGTYNQN